MINLSEDRILDFLDGRLATPDEEELLHTLAVSPERRQVMREHMKLRELTSTIARQDRFTVPERVTSQLFNKLEEAGFTPPVTPESLLLRTPQVASMRYAGAAALGAGSVATAVSSGWRFGAISLLAASVMSFVLGAGAYYVFGSTLGLRTHSQELAALQHTTRHYATPGLAQFAVSQNNVDESPASVGNASTDMANHFVPQNIASRNNAAANSIGNLNIAGILPIGFIGPMNNNGVGSDYASVPTVGGNDLASNDNAMPVTYTAPKQSYTLTSNKMQFLNGPAPILPNAIPAPFADERGTISVRYGAGQAPSSTNAPLSSLNEVRFGMTMWNYVLFRASMGQMTSYERVAQLSNSGQTKGQVVTSASQSVNTTLVGLEAGITLDPIGVPINALAGFMYSGNISTDYSPLYGRLSLMAHFQPWKMLEISGGFEGLLYMHYLGSSIKSQESFYSLAHSGSNPSEICGFVGPALELGWHF